MKIYVPTKITTEAEADALPHGTKVFHDDMSVRTPVPYLYVKRSDASFVDWQGDILYLDEIVPCTALIEQEIAGTFEDEEHGFMLGPKERPEEDADLDALYRRTTFVTEWKKSEGDQG